MPRSTYYYYLKQLNNVIYLRLLGLSFKEISEVIGRKETWAKVVFHRGKKELAKYIEGGQNERDSK